ncbi:hypothetical protein DSO57_1011038 [Entomophthora muscae]|uniref:Uncharacterized protein n=1 Tax=Entomophthora muscae TaxID=34485 RepID=A0ACC2RXJ9_9FUNG|nr:hypothetical protein DSO57_1011038 [Entomophthora muscae]
MLPYYFLPDIFQYLESNDQRQLRIVSREWNGFLLPLVFSRLSTEMYGGFEKLLRKYSEFVRELHMDSLDDNMIDLLSACKNTTRLSISLLYISPEAALILGEKFPCLSYLDLFYADSAKVSYLSPLTRKVQTLYYHINTTEEDLTVGGNNFPYVFGKFPALKTFEYAGPPLHGFQFTHFVYDVENMVFKKIGCESKNSFFSAVLHLQGDIPSKTPLLSSNQEANHMSLLRTSLTPMSISSLNSYPGLLT